MIFVDTSFWVAARMVRDDRHLEAITLLRRFGEQRLVTSNHIRGETWTFLRRKEGHSRAVAFFDMLAKTAQVDIVSRPRFSSARSGPTVWRSCS